MSSKKKNRVSKTKIGVFGIKKYDCQDTVEKKLSKVDLFKAEDVKETLEIFTSDEDGVASLIRDYCSAKEIKCTVLRTLWEQDSAAGVKRNTEILNKVSRVIVFTDNRDTYMKNVTEEAKQKKRQINTFCLNSDDAKYYKVKEERPTTETLTDQRL